MTAYEEIQSNFVLEPQASTTSDGIQEEEEEVVVVVVVCMVEVLDDMLIVTGIQVMAEVLD